MQEFFKAAIDNMAARSLRCVAIAYRSYELDKVPIDEGALEKWALPEDGLVLLAIVGIKVNFKTIFFPVNFSCHALTVCFIFLRIGVGLSNIY